MPYTYEEIHKMLEKCDERQRVIILLLASTGMRRGAVSELKVGDLKYIKQCGVYEITVYKGFKDEYKTYCSLECSSAINSYIDFRKRYGEVITPESYLIRKQFDRREKRSGEKVSLPTDPPEKHKTTEWNTQDIIYRLVYAAGIRNRVGKKTKVGDRHRSMIAHAFRKFFQNKCLEAGVDPFYVEVLMGHNIGITKHYLRPDSIEGENSLLELYLKKALPYLTISDEERLRLKNRELELRLKEDEERFKRALAETESKYSKELSKYDELQRQIQELNERIGG